MTDLSIKDIQVEDTYCEAFDGIYARMLVTAIDQKRLKRAAWDATALPCTVFGEAEGGIESWLGKEDTPDGRKGAVIQLWVGKRKGAKEILQRELGRRIRQGILVVPTTSVFDFNPSPDSKINIMEKVGYCGDGYQEVVEVFDRKMIEVPIMMGRFLIEEELGISEGIMGGNLWFMCESVESGLACCDAAEAALEDMEGVVLSFRDSCSAGSKAGGSYPEIGPTTNHPMCPTLKGKIDECEVPQDVYSIPEIVINGVDVETLKKAMCKAMEAASSVPGLKKISAGNYGGKLGRHHIHLKDLL